MKQIREVRVLHLFTFWVFPAIAIAAITALNILLSSLDSVHVLVRAVCLVLSVPSFYWLFKRFVIGSVLAYKAFAPMSVRKECRFEPSCSSYMVMAINKYGLIVGVYKGIRRILRCRPPNGGVDYP